MTLELGFKIQLTPKVVVFPPSAFSPREKFELVRAVAFPVETLLVTFVLAVVQVGSVTE